MTKKDLDLVLAFLASIGTMITGGYHFYSKSDQELTLAWGAAFIFSYCWLFTLIQQKEDK